MSDLKRRMSEQIKLVITVIATLLSAVVLAIASWFVAKKTTEKLAEDREKAKENDLFYDS